MSKSVMFKLALLCLFIGFIYMNIIGTFYNNVAILEDEDVPGELDLTDETLVNNSYKFQNVNIKLSRREITEEQLKKINELINAYDKESGIFVYNFYDGMTLTFNEDSYIFASSTIKLPYTYFVCTEVEKGNAHLEDEIYYFPHLRHNGSGILQYQPAETYHTLEELLYLAVHYSDNTAYYLLHNHFGTDGYRYIMDANEYKSNLSKTVKWDSVCTRELGKFWQKIYYKYKKGGVWDYYMSLLFGSLYSPIKDTLSFKNYSIASKSGWSDLGYHDSGIVFAKKPYALAIMTSSPGESIDRKYVSDLILAIDEYMDDYNSMYVE